MGEQQHTLQCRGRLVLRSVVAAARDHLDAAHTLAQGDIVKKRLRTIEISFHYGEMGIDAWRKAHQAMADHDADLLQEAINIAQAVKQYSEDEQEKQPHHVALACGKLTTVYARSWKRTLDSWQ